MQGDAKKVTLFRTKFLSGLMRTLNSQCIGIATPARLPSTDSGNGMLAAFNTVKKKHIGNELANSLMSEFPSLY